MKILISSKPSDDQQLLIDFFEKPDNIVQLAKNAEETLAQFSQLDPDCVFIDIDDPEIDAYYTAKKIRAACDEDSQSIPIYFMGRAQESAVIEQEKEAEADDYLMKPLSIPELEVKMGVILRLTLLRQHLLVSRLQLRDAHEQLRSLNQLISEISIKDPLTRLENRQAFEDSFERICNIATRENKAVSLLLLDIDHLKNFNDIYGIPSGDRLLQQVATILKRNLHRGSDVCARIDPGVFAAILLDTPIKGAMQVAERIRHAIEDYEIPNPVNEKPQYLTMSIGLSCAHPCTKQASHAMIAAAEQALMEAKDAGRNCVIAAQISVAPQDETAFPSSPKRRGLFPKHSQSKH